MNTLKLRMWAYANENVSMAIGELKGLNVVGWGESEQPLIASS